MPSELTYWASDPDYTIFLHRECPVSHEEMVERYGKPPGTIIVGMNPYVRSTDWTCDFCGENFDFSPGVI